MDLYQELIQNNLITPSCAELLFGKQEGRAMRLRESRLAKKTVRSVSVFYAALVSAYVVGVALKRGVTIRELEEYKPIADVIYAYWSVGTERGLHSERKQDAPHLSFLNECASCKATDIAGDGLKDIVSLLSAVHIKVVDDSRIMELLFTNEQFIEFIKQLPLLKNTEVDAQSMKLIIKGESERVECPLSPYFTFIKGSADDNGYLVEETVNEITDECYVLSSVQRGDRDYELVFNTVSLDSKSEMPKTRRIGRKIALFDNLILACRAVGIQKQWCNDDYWCNFAFIKKLANVIKPVIEKYLDIPFSMMNGEEIKKKIATLSNRLTETEYFKNHNTINEDKLDAIIYEMLITQGVYKSIFSFFYTATKLRNKSEFKLLSLMMDEFLRIGLLNKREIEVSIATARSGIETHLFKLEKIVQKNTKAYNIRVREIIAEEYTKCVLKAAGINNNKIVADEEEVLSIDDYYDMFKNPETNIEEDVTKIFQFLNAFYGGLDDIGWDFDEKKYAEAIRERKKLSEDNCSIEELFNQFEKIILNSSKINGVEKTKTNADHIIGRNSLCSIESFRFFKDKFLINLKEEKQLQEMGANKIQKPCIFISYSREDDKDFKITRFVDQIIAAGFEVFFDKEAIAAGQDWKRKVEKAISDNKTVAFCLFVSRNALKSSNVYDELKFAQDVAERRYAGDVDRKEQFIIPINIEDQNIGDYLKEFKDTFDAKKYENLSNVSRKSFITLSDINKVTDIAEKLADEGEWSDGEIIIKKPQTDLEISCANLLGFLKYGDDWRLTTNSEMVEEHFFDGKNGEYDTTHCIYPVVASVRETRIKRDNITVIGYEIIRGKGRDNKVSNYILTSKKLAVDEYYCVPNYKTVGENCSWMVEPLMISHELITGGGKE
ncbi:MAG: toll/interleukin-1 receptor domain-containing protein [Clostridia bacterium]|nr:toll/interleukin-1 receptor domain-containing protein [Clostridia bacterium]